MAQTSKVLAKTIAWLAVIADFLALFYLVITPGSILARGLVGVIVLMLSGELIRRSNRLEGAYGLYLVGGKRGIKLINKLSSKGHEAWNFFADMGLAMGVGLFSIGIVENKKAVVAGIAVLAFIILLMFPNLALMFQYMPVISSRLASEQPAASQPTFSLAYILLLLSSIVGGFALLTISLLLFSGIEIVLAIGKAVYTSNYSTLSSQLPGVMPVLPGITIPLVAGIISLAILLVVHEFSHGVLARIAKVRIKSVGVVLFGIIPFGAFVEPDEKKVRRISKKKQNRIFIAGVSANVFTAILFFSLTMLVVYAILPYLPTNGVKIVGIEANTPAASALSINETLIRWNNIPITNIYALEKIESNYSGGIVELLTSKGLVRIRPMPDGKLGVYLVPAEITPAYSFVNSLLAVLVLSFSLNLFVAIFNLLPLPGFDGWRIYKNEIKSKHLLNALVAITILSILLNLLPWLWF